MQFFTNPIIAKISSCTGKTIVNFLGGTYVVAGKRVWRIR